MVKFCYVLSCSSSRTRRHRLYFGCTLMRYSQLSHTLNHVYFAFGRPGTISTNMESVKWPSLVNKLCCNQRKADHTVWIFYDFSSFSPNLCSILYSFLSASALEIFFSSFISLAFLITYSALRQFQPVYLIFSIVEQNLIYVLASVIHTNYLSLKLGSWHCLCIYVTLIVAVLHTAICAWRQSSQIP